MTIRKSKSNPVRGVTTFAVRNGSHRYLVVRARRQWFCNCRDFFGRRLPHLGTNTFSCCKHIRRTKERIAA